MNNSDSPNLINPKDETPFANDVAQFRFMLPYLNYSQVKSDCLLDEAAYGLLDIHSYYEVVLANLARGRYLRKPSNTFDFTDFSDGKNFVTNWRNNNSAREQWTHSAQITGIGAKIGLLRIMVYNPFNLKFYFFAIPHRFYAGMSQVDIVFETFTSKTEPKLSEGDGRIDELKWGRRFRISSIENLALVPGDWDGSRNSLDEYFY